MQESPVMHNIMIIKKFRAKNVRHNDADCHVWQGTRHVISTSRSRPSTATALVLVTKHIKRKN